VTVALPVEVVTLGNVRIVLTETTFAAVANKLGRAPLAHAGDAGGSRTQACYRSADPQPTTYYLESGEMGANEQIMQVDVISAGSAAATPDPPIARECRVLAPATTARTDRGIRLGLSRAEVDRRLRVRGRDSAGIAIYDRSEKRRIGGRTYDAWAWLHVRYLENRVVAFSAGAVYSY
jgi:hypothetical protein